MPLQNGATFAGYTVRRLLGSGGMGEVYLVDHPRLPRHDALKVLRESRLVTEERVGRERIYTLDPVPLQRVAGWIEGYRSFWQSSLTRLKRHLEET